MNFSSLEEDVWECIRYQASPLTGRILNIVCTRFWQTRRYKRKLYPTSALALQENEYELYQCYYNKKSINWIWLTASGSSLPLEELETVFSKLQKQNLPKEKYITYCYQAAASHGRLDILQALQKYGFGYYRNYFGSTVFGTLLLAMRDNVTLARQMEIIEWAHKTFANPDKENFQTCFDYQAQITITQNAANLGKAVFIWFKEHGYRYNDSVSRVALFREDIELLKYFTAEEMDLDEQHWYHAGASRKPEIHALLEEHVSFAAHHYCIGAVKKGYLDKLETLERIDWSGVLIGAVSAGNLSLVERCLKEGQIVNEALLRRVAMRGQVEILKYLQPHIKSWPTGLPRLAIGYRHLPMLKYLAEVYPKEYWKDDYDTLSQRILAPTPKAFLKRKKIRRWLRKHDYFIETNRKDIGVQ